MSSHLKDLYLNNNNNNETPLPPFLCILIESRIVFSRIFSVVFPKEKKVFSQGTYSTYTVKIHSFPLNSSSKITLLAFPWLLWSNPFPMKGQVFIFSTIDTPLRLHTCLHYSGTQLLILLSCKTQSIFSWARHSVSFS